MPMHARAKGEQTAKAVENKRFSGKRHWQRRRKIGVEILDNRITLTRLGPRVTFLGI